MSIKFNRPGVSDEFLANAGCHHVGEDECDRRYGCRAEGIAIPFRKMNGEAIMDNDRQFARVRLNHATEDQKYHQRPGSHVHIYVPPFAQSPKGPMLLLVEGEFKALALAEAKYSALGLCGFNGATCKITRENGAQPHALNDELVGLLEMRQPAHIVFLGDADVVLNAGFSIEVAKLRRLLLGSKHLPFIKRFTVAKLPLGGGPKGVDDLREQKVGAFAECLGAILCNGYDVPSKVSTAECFVELLQREMEGVKRLVAQQDHEGSRTRSKLLQSAAQLWNEPVAQLDLKPLLAEALGVTKSEVNGLIKTAASNRKARHSKTQEANRESRARAGQTGRSSLTPAQWLSDKFPSLSAEHGTPIQERQDESGMLHVRDINEDFLAATLGKQGSPATPTVFVPTEQKFYTYVHDDGVFVHQREPVLLAGLSRLLLHCARECCESCETESLAFRFRDVGQLNGVLRKARGLLEVPSDFFSSDLTEFLPVANGMLRLKDRELLPFSPKYRRRNKLAVPFVRSAKCPLFLETLMHPALSPDDLNLVQRWCGQALIGENLAQKIMLLSGTAGSGKGTFIRILNGIIGQSNLASLRPRLLGERFELGRFLGRTLLYGADVPEDFLNHHGASVLKSLTGADPVTLEFKNSNESPSIICRFNVIVTCNSRLSVRLQNS